MPDRMNQSHCVHECRGRCSRSVSFVVRFIVDDAPPELEAVEAAMDAEPREWWVPWVRALLVLVCFAVWAAVGYLLFH